MSPREGVPFVLHQPVESQALAGVTNDQLH